MHGAAQQASSRSRKQTRRSTDATPTVAARATGASAARRPGGGAGRRLVGHGARRFTWRGPVIARSCGGATRSSSASSPRARRNERYLPGVDIPAVALDRARARARAGVGRRAADRGAESRAFARCSRPSSRMLRAGTRVAWATKGFELDSGLLPNQVARAVLGQDVPYGRAVGAHLRAGSRRGIADRHDDRLARRGATRSSGPGRCRRRISAPTARPTSPVSRSAARPRTCSRSAPAVRTVSAMAPTRASRSSRAVSRK